MEQITSGSTTERIIRTSLITVFALGAAGWCFYDAYVKYPLQNLERAVRDLTPPPELSRDLIVPAVDAKSTDAIDKRTFLKDLVARFGEPGWRGKNAKGKSEARFFGPAGQLIVTLDPGDRATKARFAQAEYKNAKDLAVQKGMGVVIGLLGVLLLVHWLRVMIVKATMTDEGIKLVGHPLVPFDALTELHAEEYAKKGCVGIDYEMDARAGTLRLDDYKIKAFPEIIAEICRRKEWEDPYEKWQQKKAASK